MTRPKDSHADSVTATGEDVHPYRPIDDGSGGQVCGDCTGDPDDSIHTQESTIDITPDYPAVMLFFANTLRLHGFQKGAKEPVVALIEMTLYLYKTDPWALKALIDRLREGPG